MKNFNLITVLLICLFVSKITAQKTFEDRAKAIAEKIENITKEEKALLKSNVEEVNVQLEKGEITKEVADKKKMDLATATAANIEKRVGEEQDKLNVLVQDRVNGEVKVEEELYVYVFGFKFNRTKNNSTKKNRGERRTTSQFVFAAGVNNVVTGGSTANSDFRYWGSRFYEWGSTYNYRLLKDDGLLHLKYGFSVMYNNLRSTNNRVFEVNDNKTTLVSNPTPTTDSRLKNVYLVLPLHLEFDFSDKKTYNGKSYFASHRGFRMGVGGYAGINLKTKQYIETDINGYEIESVTKADFNTSNFIYGLSGYIGYSQTSLYVKYDMNPLFRNNDIKQNNISLGIRFDFN
jgi:hypothetical protein